jgi:threonine synthase
MGYREEFAAGNATKTPKMYGFQAAGAAPLVLGRVVEEPSTIATAIRIGNPASWTKAIEARDESGGSITAVTDREILSAYRLLARTVGVFVELGSAASVAGLLQAADQGRLPAGGRVVCTVTGHGLKDPEWAISTAPAPTTIAADVLAAARALDLA